MFRTPRVTPRHVQPLPTSLSTAVLIDHGQCNSCPSGLLECHINNSCCRHICHKVFAAALDIELDANGCTGINVTGTNDLAPLDQQAQIIADLFPDVKQVGILYCSAEVNSVYQADISPLIWMI